MVTTPKFYDIEKIKKLSFVMAENIYTKFH